MRSITSVGEIILRANISIIRSNLAFAVAHPLQAARIGWQVRRSLRRVRLWFEIGLSFRNLVRTFIDLTCLLLLRADTTWELDIDHICDGHRSEGMTTSLNDGNGHE